MTLWVNVYQKGNETLYGPPYHYRRYKKGNAGYKLVYRLKVKIK